MVLTYKLLQLSLTSDLQSVGMRVGRGSLSRNFAEGESRKVAVGHHKSDMKKRMSIDGGERVRL